MSDTHKSTRLGALLVERGAISRAQLKEAVDLQQDHLYAIQSGKGTADKKELGEILIELGFINRQQLKTGLGWQHKLRKTTFVMAFVAPLLTAACGGGGAGGGSTHSTDNSQSQNVSSQPVNPPLSQSSSSSASSVSLAPASSSSVSSSSAPASSSSSSSQGAMHGPVVIYWSVPTHRENGDDLDITEIGGYELRYKLKNSANVIAVDIPSGFTDTYYFDYLEGDYEFQLATYDTNGLYSQFVTVNPE